MFVILFIYNIYLFVCLYISFSVHSDGEGQSFHINYYSLSTVHSIDVSPIPISIH
jgi:hypothetical protein